MATSSITFSSFYNMFEILKPQFLMRRWKINLDSFYKQRIKVLWTMLFVCLCVYIYIYVFVNICIWYCIYNNKFLNWDSPRHPSITRNLERVRRLRVWFPLEMKSSHHFITFIYVLSTFLILQITDIWVDRWWNRDRKNASIVIFPRVKLFKK